MTEQDELFPVPSIPTTLHWVKMEHQLPPLGENVLVLIKDGSGVLGYCQKFIVVHGVRLKDGFFTVEEGKPLPGETKRAKMHIQLKAWAKIIAPEETFK